MGTAITAISLVATGTGSISYNSATLPSGLSISGSTIIGTPDTAGASSTATISATDDNGSTSKEVTFPIVSAATTVSWTFDTPSAGSLGEFSEGNYFDQTFGARIGGMSLYTRYKLVEGVGILPDGLMWQGSNPTLTMGDAQISGTIPSIFNQTSYNFTIKAFEEADTSNFNTRAFSITVLKDPTCISPSNNVCA